MFLSAGVAFEANVEALNLVETTGNYSRHRKIPYIWRDQETKEFRVIYVPAISGESLAHAYQELLVEEATRIYGREEKVPVCPDCKTGEFFKSMNKAHLRGKFEGDPSKTSPDNIEKEIIKKCLVEDIGGFLYAEKPPIKRSSSFQFSYAVPVKTTALLSTVEPQLHARHARMIEVKKKSQKEDESTEGEVQNKERKAEEQMLYYVEAGTAIYGFVFNLDLEAIGKSSYDGKPVINDEEIKKRKNVAISAFARLVSSRQFGAKLSRFFPAGDIVSLYVAVTSSPFSVTSPIYETAALTTAKRLNVISNIFKEEVRFYLYESLRSVEDLKKFGFVKISETPEEAILHLLEGEKK